MKIAYFSPLPPERSGIADYSRDLLPHLKGLAEVTLFANEPESVVEELQSQFAILPMSAYAERRWQFDATVYQMGNSSVHEGLYQMMLRYPGIVVLHDYFLHHFMAHRTAGQGDLAGYAREFGFELGLAGINQVWRLREGLEETPLYEVPLNGRILATSLGVIAHSEYVRGLIAQKRPSLHTAVIPEIMVCHEGKSCRAELDWPKDALIFGSVGQITTAKQIDLALRVFKRVQEQVSNGRYLLVGEAVPEVNVAQLVADLELSGLVHHLGRVAEFQAFIDWTYTPDVVLNLRYPTIGETSAAALRVMAAERPLIVFDHGWYSEIPDEACVKVAPMDEEQLFEAMLGLATSAAKRQALGKAAVAYIETVCQPTAVAQQYVHFIENHWQRVATKYV